MPEKLEKMIVGVDLGGSKINAILADSRGNISRQVLKDTLAQEGPDAVILRVIECIKQAASSTDIAGIGIGAAGACDVESIMMLMLLHWGNTILAVWWVSLISSTYV